jgi:hypothetical protein
MLATHAHACAPRVRTARSSVSGRFGARTAHRDAAPSIAHRRASWPVARRIAARSAAQDDDADDDADDVLVIARRSALALLALAPLASGPALDKLSGGPTGGIPIEQFQEIPGTKPPILYYDLKGASGATGGVPKGARVAVHYDLKFRNITIGTSRQGAGVTGGTPIGFNVGAKSGTPGGPFIPAFNEGIKGMGVGTVRRMIVPPEYAYGNLEVQEIPPGATITLDLELLSVAKDPIRGGVAGAQQEQN